MLDKPADILLYLPYLAALLLYLGVAGWMTEQKESAPREYQSHETQLQK